MNEKRAKLPNAGLLSPLRLQGRRVPCDVLPGLGRLTADGRILPPARAGLLAGAESAAGRRVSRRRCALARALCADFAQLAGRLPDAAGGRAVRAAVRVRRDRAACRLPPLSARRARIVRPRMRLLEQLRGGAGDVLGSRGVAGLRRGLGRRPVSGSCARAGAAPGAALPRHPRAVLRHDAGPVARPCAAAAANRANAARAERTGRPAAGRGRGQFFRGASPLQGDLCVGRRGPAGSAGRRREFAQCAVRRKILRSGGRAGRFRGSRPAEWRGAFRFGG